MFWVFLATMSGNEGERTGETIGFTQDYITFMEELERYLSEMFPNVGFGGHMRTYISMLLKSINTVIDDMDTALLAGNENVENPLYQ